jgi:hypothetical protein
MKTRFFILLIFSIFVLNLSADGNPNASINLEHRHTNHNHSEYYPPADMPEVFLDSDNLQIILVADGFSSYYDVVITQMEYYVPIISTLVDGYGDTIDVSSLSEGYYTITITSEFNNVFVGTFYIE